MNSTGSLVGPNLEVELQESWATVNDRHRSSFPVVKPLLVLVGPTAIGKSRVALHVAHAMGTEILTADSTQVYRGMDIGTDKPTSLEWQGVPHHLTDLVAPDQPFNAGEFRRHAMVEIDRLHREGRIPLVVGGTGLYVRALLQGLWPGPPVDLGLRRRLEQEACEHGLDALYRELVRVDPDSARHVHPHDRIKVLRALEVYRQIGVPLSKAHRRHGFKERPFRALVIGLTMDRAALYRRIEARVEVELEKGLVQETQRLLDRGYTRDLVSMKSLGYRQIAGFLVGEYSFDEAVRRLKRDTRHFAKRQLTWFRKEPEITWLEVKEQEAPESTAAQVLVRVERLIGELGKLEDLEPGFLPEVGCGASER